MNSPVQQQAQDTELTPGMAYQYLGQLVSEYMKTLPAPIRAPVISMVNQANEVLGKALNELAIIQKEQIERLPEPDFEKGPEPL